MRLLYYVNGVRIRFARRQAVKGWAKRLKLCKRERGPGKQAMRRGLLFLAAGGVMWGIYKGGYIGLILKDMAGFHIIEERVTGGDMFREGEPTVKTGLNFRLEDGSFTIFRVRTYEESGSD